MPGKTKKQAKAMNKSRKAANTFKRKFNANMNDGSFLGKVVKTLGGGRFTVVDLNDSSKGELVVRIAPALFAKGAKHRNTEIPTAVHNGSFVIVDGGVIRSVVGAAEAATMRRGVPKNANNDLFNYVVAELDGGRRTRRNRRNH
jgi:hypothetical protein